VNANKQFFWFLMNAVLMCIFIVPVSVAFWLSVFTAGFDWNQWVKLATDAASSAASEPARTLGTVMTCWGFLSFFLMVMYSFMFSLKPMLTMQFKKEGAIRLANEVGVAASENDSGAVPKN
jgi:hypothetical protein